MNFEEKQAAEAEAPLSEHELYKRQQDERSWAMLCHISVFLSAVIPFGNIVGPLVVWMVKRDQYPLVKDQGRESLNFQITMTIFSGILLIVLIVGLISFAAEDNQGPFPRTALFAGLGLLALGIINTIFIIIAAIRSYKGEQYRYPFSIHFVS